MHARHTHISDSAEHNAGRQSGAQDTGGRAHTQSTIQTQGAMRLNQAASGHTQQKAASPEPSTPTQTAPEDQGMPEVEANIRYSQHQLSVPLTTGPVRAECSSSPSRLATAARSGEEQVHRTTAPDQSTGDPQRSQNPFQHTNYSDRATEYSANATLTCRRTPSPDRPEYST